MGSMWRMWNEGYIGVEEMWVVEAGIYVENVEDEDKEEEEISTVVRHTGKFQLW